MNILSFFLVPLIGIFSFLKDWFYGFQIKDVLNRRLDFIATNILVTTFLTGFKPLFSAITNLFLCPIMFVVGIFKPEIKKNYYEKQFNKLLTKQSQLELQNEKLTTQKTKMEKQLHLLKKTTNIKLESKRKKFERKISSLENQLGIVKDPLEKQKLEDKKNLLEKKLELVNDNFSEMEEIKE